MMILCFSLFVVMIFVFFVSLLIRLVCFSVSRLILLIGSFLRLFRCILLMNFFVSDVKLCFGR